MVTWKGFGLFLLRHLRLNYAQWTLIATAYETGMRNHWPLAVVCCAVALIAFMDSKPPLPPEPTLPELIKGEEEKPHA